MKKKTLTKNRITKEELLKDYIDFILVILLSFFIKYDAKEVALSIWFYSVVITYLLVFKYLFDCLGLIKSNFTLFLKTTTSFFIWGICCWFFFRIQLVFLNAGFGAETLEDASIFDLGNFILFVPFLPFAIYKYREYFKKTLKESELKNVGQRMFYFCYKCQFLAIFSIIIGIIYRYNPQLSFFIIYTLFFFPFLKTFKFLRKKRGHK